MGFCRRCGEIVANGSRCACGGSSTAPTVFWESKDKVQDQWLKTYAPKDAPKSKPAVSHVVTPVIAQSTGTERSHPTKRFPRPLSTSSPTVTLGNRVSAHITSTTSQLQRPPSPLKNVTTISPEKGILPSMTGNDNTLSKVYGSILQPKESLEAYSCAECATQFPPDATIYPDPTVSAAAHRFLCRSCFTANGGSPGTCAECQHPVLALKSEGKFIQAAGKVWHKRCFCCSGCGKDLSHSPMVDLLGHPCCGDCFDTSLKRDHTPTKLLRTSITSSPRPTNSLRTSVSSSSINVGGTGTPPQKPGRSREGSPALVEELEQRLGITPRRELSPELRDLSDRFSTLKKNRSSVDNSPSVSPLTRFVDRKRESLSIERSVGSNSSPSPKRISLESELRSPSLIASRVSSQTRNSLTKSHLSSLDSQSSPSLSSASSTSTSLWDDLLSSRSSSTSRFPDLASDDSVTQYSSSGPTTPPKSEYDPSIYSSDRNSVDTRVNFDNAHNSRKEDAIRRRPLDSVSGRRSLSRQLSSPNLNGTDHTLSRCAKCHLQLWAIERSGEYITIPGENTSDPSKTFHRDCFRCAVCNKAFNDNGNGKAGFTYVRGGVCHIACAPRTPVKTHVKTKSTPIIIPDRDALPRSTASPPSKPTSYGTSSRYDRPPATAPAATTIFPRFGGSMTCPGCKKSVSIMERGVIPGPHNTRWHGACLVCGGKKPATPWPHIQNEHKKPGCGKKLDSAAKLDGKGGIWCRECMLRIPSDSLASSIVLTNSASSQGTIGKVTTQVTGTTLARQFTGMGTGEASLLRQMTGGRTSPTRNVSPTKYLGRPKSVIGMRNTKSVDEGGRGMFLVRQMTGSGGIP